LHQPLFFGEIPISKPVVALFHVTYYGKWLAFREYRPTAPETFYYALATQVERLALKCLANHNVEGLTVVAVSSSVASELLQVAPSLGEVAVIPFTSAVATSTASSLQSSKLVLTRTMDRHTLRILWVGRLIRVKNPDYALRLIQLLRRDLDVRLTMVGDGPLGAHLKGLCTKMGLSDSVTFLGRVKHETLMAVMQSHDFLLSTSIYEGLPLSVVEALSDGLTPLLPDIPSFRKMFADLDAGCLFSLNDVHAAAKSIRSCVLARRKTLDSRASLLPSCYSPEGIAVEYSRILGAHSID